PTCRAVAPGESNAARCGPAFATESGPRGATRESAMPCPGSRAMRRSPFRRWESCGRRNRVRARCPTMMTVRLTGHYRAGRRYPAAIVNVTNRCNLACAHCFVFRDGNPNAAPASVRDEPSDDEILATLAALRDRHGIASMLWMGGEPLLRRRLVERGLSLFARNTVTTNGTVPLPDFGPDVLFVVSLDGPEDLNDALRGAGTYRRVMRTLDRLPVDFSSPVQVQCVVTRRNERRLGELVEAVRATRV